MTTQKNDRFTVYRVFGNVCFTRRIDSIGDADGDALERDDDIFRYLAILDRVGKLGRDFANEAGSDDETPKYVENLITTEVHLYDVYHDGTFHFFNPVTDKPMKEPEEFVQDRKEIVDYVESNAFIGSGGIEGWNRASREIYQPAYETLCRLGFCPELSYYWDVPNHNGPERNTVKNFRVEYFGEDEPWIDVYEYDRRNGVEGVTYD